MDNKQNDWILETLLNPTFTFDDFKDNNIDASNTSMYDRDKYLNSPVIQSLPQFQTNGKFDRTKFNTFYDYAKDSYLSLAQLTYNKSESVPKAIYSYNNVWVSPEKRSWDVDFSVEKINNPNRQKMGIESIGYISNPTMTPLEIALNEKIYNPKTDSWEESPNDSWLFRNWFEPVAMASYDYDVDVNGNPTTVESEIVHRKGEYKINPETGTYYYEKLNGRTPYGKDLLSPFDILTRDGSSANKFDFFDSDSISKSFGGSVAKTVARIAPMLIPGFGEYYVAANIALELGLALPIIYKTTFGLGSSDNSLLNTIEGVAASFSANRVSLEGQQSFFNSENILNLIGDVSKLLYEQRWLFTKAPAVFKKYSITKGPKNTPSALDKEIEKRAAMYKSLYLSNDKMLANLDMSTMDITRAMNLYETDAILTSEAAAKAAVWGEKYLKSYQELGKWISRMYMTTTASYQAYLDAINEGASDMEAAMVFWGYLAGEYAIISSELGERVLPELRTDKIEIRNMLEAVSLKAGAVDTSKKVIGIAEDRIKLAKGLKKLFLRSSDLALKTFSKALRPVTVGGGSLFANALGEGVEELTEEFWYDMTRSTFNLLQFLAGDEFRLSAFDNWAARYGQSFFGGALGGAMFEGINNMKNLRSLYNPDTNVANQLLIYHIRNGRALEIRDTLRKMRDEHAFGNPNLSSTPIATKEDEDGLKSVVFGEGTLNDNQNDSVYNLMLAYVDNIEKVLSQENMIIPDHKLINSDGVNEKEVLQLIRYQYLLNSPTDGNMLQDFHDLSDRFLDLHSQLGALEAVTDPTKRSDTWQDEVNEVKRQLEELRKERENFFTPETLLKYIKEMMFASNNSFSQPFVNITFKDFAESNFHKPILDLSEYEATLAKLRYADYLAYEAKKAVRQGFNTFMNLNEKLSATMQLLGTDGYKKLIDARNKLLSIQVPVIDENSPLFKLVLDTGVEGKQLSILDYITLYGTEEMTEEELQKSANSLKLLYNPFDEILNVLVLKSPFINIEGQLKDELPVKLTFLKEILTTLLDVTKDIQLDSSTANSMNEIVKLIVSMMPRGEKDWFRELDASISNASNAVYSIYRKFRTDINLGNISDKYNTLVKELDALSLENPDLSEEAEDLKAYIADELRYPLAETELQNTVKQINNILSNSVLNPISSILSQLKVTRDGNKSVFDIINKANSIFMTKDIRDFILDGEITLDDVKDARLVIRELEAVIRAMLSDNINAINPFGFNATVNKIMKNKDLGEIDGETAALLLLDLYVYDKKLSFLLQLHDSNRESTLKEQLRVGVNLLYLAFDVIGDTESSLYKVAENGVIADRKIVGDDGTTEKLINTEILTAIKNANTIKEQIAIGNRIVDISDLLTLITMAKELNAIEEALHKRFIELFTKYGRINVLLQIMPGFIDFTELSTDAKHTDGTSGIYSDTPTFNDLEKLAYFASIIATKPLDFEYLYTLAISEDTTGIAPTPVLKFTIRTLYGNLINPNIYNDIVKASGAENMSLITLPNTVFATGIPGSGKTSACARLAVSMFRQSNPDLKVWACGPAKIHAKNLKESIGVESAEEYDSDGLLDILGTTEAEINNNSIVTVSETQIDDLDDAIKILLQKIGANKVKKIILNTISPKIGEVPNIILIDEYTHFTATELMYISLFAADNNIPLVCLGDPGQSGKSMPLTKTIDNEASNVFGISSPKLTISMRASNTNKRDNQQFTKALSERYNSYADLELGKRSDTLWEELLTIGSTDGKFKYTKASNGALYGDCVMGRDEIDLGTIRNLIPTLRPGEKIGIIYESTDSSIYQLVSQLKPSELEHVEIINSTILFDEKSALGNECLYFIIDIDWAAKKNKQYSENPGEKEIEKFQAYQAFTKALNTITSRSKWGSIIVDDAVEGQGFASVFDLNAFEEIPENSVSIIDNFKNDDVLKNYKENQIAILEALVSGYTYSPVPINDDTNISASGISEVLLGDFDPLKVDFTRNVVIAMPGGRNPLPTLESNRAYVFRDNPDDGATVIRNATELQKEINNYVGENKNLVVAIVPKAEFTTSSLSEFLKLNGNPKALNIKYLKYVIKYLKNAATKINYTYKFNVGTKCNYKGLLCEVVDRKNGNYYIRNLITGNVSIILNNDFEKNVTPFPEEVKNEARIESALADNILEANNRTHSATEVENVIKYTESEDGLGLLLYTNFGYRSGVSLVKDNHGQPIIEEVNGILCYQIGGYGHLDMHMSDMQALLLLDNPEDPNSIHISPYSTENKITYVPVETYNKAKNALADIRSIIKDGTDNIDIKVTSLLRSLGLNIPDGAKGTFNLRVSMDWDSKVDEIFNTANPNIENHRQVVYTITDSLGRDLDITLGTIQSSKAAKNYVKSISKQIPPENKLLVQEAFERLIAFLDHLESKLFNGKKERTLYFSLNGGISDLTKITNVILRYISHENTLSQKGVEPAELKRVEYDQLRENKNLIVSPLFMITGVAKGLTVLSKVRNGSVVCFTTEIKDFEYNGERAKNKPNILAYAYKDACLNGDTALLLKIKCIVLTPNGLTFKDYMQSVIENKNSIAPGSNEDIVMPIGNVNTSSRLLRLFLMIDAALTEFIRGGYLKTSNFSLEGTTSEPSPIVFLDEQEALKLKNNLDQLLARTIAIIENWEEYIHPGDKTKTEGTGKLYTLDEVLSGEVTIRNSIELLLDEFTNDNAVTNLREKFDKLTEGPLADGTTPIDAWVDGGKAAEFAKHRTFNISTAFNSFFAIKNKSTGSYEFKDNNTSEILLLNWLSDNLPAFKYYVNPKVDSNFPEGIYFNPIYKKGDVGLYDLERKAEEMFYPVENIYGQKFFANIDPQTSTHMLTNDIVAALKESIGYTDITVRADAKYEVGLVFSANVKLGNEKSSKTKLAITKILGGNYHLIKIKEVENNGKTEFEKVWELRYIIPIKEFEESIANNTEIERKNSVLSSIKENDSYTKKYKTYSENNIGKWKKLAEEEKGNRGKKAEELTTENTLKKVDGFLLYISNSTPKLDGSTLGISSLGVINNLEKYKLANILTEEGLKAFCKEYYKKEGHYPDYYDILKHYNDILSTTLSIQYDDLLQGDLFIFYVSGSYYTKETKLKEKHLLGTLNEYITLKVKLLAQFENSPIYSISNILLNGEDLTASVRIGSTIYLFKSNINNSLNPSMSATTVVGTDIKPEVILPSQIDIKFSEFISNMKNKILAVNKEELDTYLIRGKLPGDEKYDLAKANYDASQLVINSILNNKKPDLKKYSDLFYDLILYLGMGDEYEQIHTDFETWCEDTNSCAIAL